MRRITMLNVCLLVATLVAFGAGSFYAAAGSNDDDEQTGSAYARAIVTGAPGSGIHGVVTFRQRPCPGCPTPGLAAPATDRGFENFPEPTVDVDARITGPSTTLTPGAHGMHIHETAIGGCVSPFASAGGHFDPGPFGNSTPVDANHPFHMGDLPNLIVRGGVGRMSHTTSRITLSPGPLSVFDANGSIVIVHLSPDRGINGVAGASGGARIACGVIVPDSPQGDDDD